MSLTAFLTKRGCRCLTEGSGNEWSSGSLTTTGGDLWKGGGGGVEQARDGGVGMGRRAYSVVNERGGKGGGTEGRREKVLWANPGLVCHQRMCGLWFPDYNLTPSPLTFDTKLVAWCKY